MQEEKRIQVGRDLGGLVSNQSSASCKVVQGFVELGLENLQWWCLHDLHAQPVFVLGSSNS